VEGKVANNCGSVRDSDPTGRYLLSDDSFSAAPRSGINEISLSDWKCIPSLPNVETKTAIFAQDGQSLLYATVSPEGTKIYRQRRRDGKLVGLPTVEISLPFSVVSHSPLSIRGFVDYGFSIDLSSVVFSRPDNRADLYLMSGR
jgi:hypothetical protein